MAGYYVPDSDPSVATPGFYGPDVAGDPLDPNSQSGYYRDDSATTNAEYYSSLAKAYAITPMN